MATLWKGAFFGANGRISIGIVISDRSGLAGNGLVDDFEHADVAEVVVGVNKVRHLLEECIGPLVLVVLIEASASSEL